MSPDRRTLLKALAGLSTVALAGHATPALAQAGSTLTAAGFGRLSAALTGYPVAGAGTVGKVMKAFATPARRAALAALAKIVAATPPADLDAALRARKLDTLANDLVALWYSGIATAGKDGQLVLYTDAYVWTAMTWSKPMGVCGGATGYWAHPPA